MATNSQPAQKTGSDALRLRGRVFAIHYEQGQGHARLPDNRQVWISKSDLVNKSAQLRLGDVIEFQLERSLRGLIAKRIVIVVEGSKTESPSRQDAIPVPQSSPRPAKTEAIEVPPDFTPHQTEIPPTGEAAAYYQSAAVARV